MLLEDLERYGLLKAEYRAERKKCNKRLKPLRDEMALLEADIKRQVLEAGQTVQVGNIKAEYVPTVVINIVKENKENAE